MSRPPRRRRRWLVVGVLVVLVLVGAVVAVRSTSSGAGLSGQSRVSVSSVALGSSPRQLVTNEDSNDPDRGWHSNGETTGAWVELTWDRPVALHRVELERDPLDRAGILAGFLTFGDGSQVNVQLSSSSRTTVVPITPRSVDRVRFTVTAAAEQARTIALSRFLVDGQERPDGVATDVPGDGVAAVARLSSSLDGGDDLRRLVDAGSGGGGQPWEAAGATGQWVQLDWSRPREVTTVAVAGAPGPGGLRRGTLLFSDGSQLTLGAVLADSRRPTVISFMPRVVTSIRLTFDEIDSGTLALAEVSVDQRGAPPRRAVGGVAAPVRSTALDCGRLVERPTDEVGLVVTCPTNGAVVDGRVAVAVATGPSYTSTRATLWPSEPTAPVPPSVEKTPVNGSTSFDLEVGSLPAGPLTVFLEASGRGQRTVSVSFQLYRRSLGPEPTPVTPEVAQGRHVVYAEEFDRALSLSRTGAGADYATAKPVVGAAEDFGFAIFADPEDRFGNVQVVDDRFLKIAVEPRPADFADPKGWGRQHIGGLLASARPGGSGFSAQYGYFEARMLAPAGTGTWPAFWMLSTPNLIEPQRAVAEIDAVELYGHEPTGACHTTHGYVEGEDDGVAHCGQRWDSRREAAAWHTYGVSVGPVEVSYYIDGRLVATAPQVAGGGEPLFFLVNLALGGGWPIDLAPTQDRADLYVDYVRVYV